MNVDVPSTDAAEKARQNLRNRTWNMRRKWHLIDKREAQPGVWACMYHNGFGDFKVSSRIVDDLNFKPRSAAPSRETGLYYEGGLVESAIEAYMTA